MGTGTGQSLIRSSHCARWPEPVPIFSQAQTRSANGQGFVVCKREVFREEYEVKMKGDCSRERLPARSGETNRHAVRESDTQGVRPRAARSAAIRASSNMGFPCPLPTVPTSTRGIILQIRRREKGQFAGLPRQVKPKKIDLVSCK
jgi:hypothetical protein